MLLSILIKKLQEHYDEFGDMPVNMIMESKEHNLQMEYAVGSTAVSIQYRKEGKEVKIPQKVIIIQEGFE